MILYYSITVFVTQLIFIGCRTWNVKSIAKGNLLHVLVSGAFVHLSWLVSIAIGAVSMSEILTNFDWKYIPVILCSLSGGLIGSWIGMIEKQKK
jgi:Na+/citrate or Na+/malate symporter